MGFLLLTSQHKARDQYSPSPGPQGYQDYTLLLDLGQRRKRKGRSPGEVVGLKIAQGRSSGPEAGIPQPWSQMRREPRLSL